MPWSWAVFGNTITQFGYAQAAWTSLWVAAVAEALGLVIGTGLALLALSRSRAARGVAWSYIWVWRGTPILVQLIILYFGMPELGLRLSVMTAAFIGLGCNEASYLAVIIKTSMLAIPSAQIDAGRTLGLSRAQRLLHVEFPQAARTIVPTLGNQFNSMIKTTALLSVISVSELLRYTENQVANTYQPLEPFAVAALYYLALSYAWAGVQRLIEHRLDPARKGARRAAIGNLVDAMPLVASPR